MVAVAACASEDKGSPIPEGAILFAGQFAEPVFWDYPTSSVWASTPTLAVARARGVYPVAPDFELAIACGANGELQITGDVYRIATDVGGSGPIPSRLGLRTSSVDLGGEPVWSYTGYDQYAKFAVSPTRDQLSQLVSSEWLEAYIPFSDGDGGMKYPAPPLELAQRFLTACEALADVR